MVVAGGADRPTPAAQGHFIDNHAYCMVDMETPERCGLRQCATFGDFSVRRHQG
jgi:hypothetical protein